MAFTVNKNIQQPASGSFDNAWAAPVNANWEDIDNAFGGLTNLNVTGITTGQLLTVTQYQPPNIVITGTLSNAVGYFFPSGVGGVWTIYNNTSGSFIVNIGNDIAGGRVVTLPQGNRSLVVSDGTNVDVAVTVAVAFSQLTGQIANGQVPSSAVTQYQGALAIGFTQLTGSATVAQIPALPASQITSGTIANAVLPNAAAGPGVTIAADPNTTPSGTFGDIFYYY